MAKMCPPRGLSIAAVAAAAADVAAAADAGLTTSGVLL